MNKFRIIFFSLLIAIGIFLIGKFIFQMVHSQSCWHESIVGQENKYYSLFDSSEIKNLRKVYSFGNNETEDYDFIYLYKNQYRFIIFEHRSLNLIDPHQIHNFTTIIDKNKSKINPSSGAQFGWGPSLKYESAPCLEFDNKLSIFFGKSLNLNILDSNNYRCFIGEFSNVLLRNGKDINQILLGFDSQICVPTYLYFYKTNSSFYIIIVNSMSSEYDLSSCSKILNLR